MTSSIGPSIHVAMSIRWLPRSPMVLPPIDDSNRQSKAMSGSTNSSESQVPRQRWTSPSSPFATISAISETAGRRR